MKEQGVQESAEQPREGPSTARRGPAEVLRIKHWNKSNWPKEAEESSRHHKELWSDLLTPLCGSRNSRFILLRIILTHVKSRQVPLSGLYYK